MHLTFRNVNDAFNGLVRGVHRKDFPLVEVPSRAGDVIMLSEPMTITYTSPRERVLLNTARDANPFFHLYEALWMLAGRNDVAPLAYYSSKIGEIASDDGETFNGAYGYRWRKATGYDGDEPLGHIDQLKIIIDHLKKQPNSRRSVLQMWNVEDDLLKIEAKEKCVSVGCRNGKWENGAGRAMLEEGANCPICLGTAMSGTDYSKDVCCNTAAYFAIREGDLIEDEEKSDPHRGTFWKRLKYLDMTVTNRSNDLIWGMLGANVVHFSILQEYMAAQIGVRVGHYHQFTNNLHVYKKVWEPEKWLTDTYCNGLEGVYPTDRTELVKDPKVFDEEVVRFVKMNYATKEELDNLRGSSPRPLTYTEWKEPFLQEVAQPMMMAFHHHKLRRYPGAYQWLSKIKSPAWYLAAQNWISRRGMEWNKRNPYLVDTPAASMIEWE